MPIVSGSSVARGAATLIALLVAHSAWEYSLGRYLRARWPAAALERSPADTVAFQKILDAQVATGQLRRISTVDDRNARAALIESPINGSAFRIIGMYAEQLGNNSRAAEAFALSESVTRRNTFVQLWLIEHAVARGNVRQALVHYDAALSVRPGLSDVLFPILSTAIADPIIKAELRPYVLRRASWVGSFLSYAAMRGEPHEVMTLLAPLAPKLQGEWFDDICRTLANRLVDVNNITAALGVVTWRRPRALLEVSSLRVAPGTLDRQLGVFGWQLLSEQGLNVSPNDQNGFDVGARPFSDGVAAVRVVPVLTGRRYVFQQRLKADGAERGNYRWRITCIGSSHNEPIFNQSVRSSDRIQRWVLLIPKRCVGLRFSLHVNGPDEQLATTASVSNLALYTS